MHADHDATGGNASRPDPAPADCAFPPLTISLDTFVKNGSDRSFRELMFELIALYNRMQLMSERFARHIGTTGLQFHVVMALAQTPDQTVNQIAELMNVTSPAVTIEIGGLVRKGLIERRPNENNRRSSLLSLTAKGQDVVRQVAPLLRRANDLHFRALTTEQAKVLREALQAIDEDGRRIIEDFDAVGSAGAMAPPET